MLGDGADLHALAALAGVERAAAAAILDGLAAASILAADGEPGRFVHPLLRTASTRRSRPATRAEMHARAARLLREHGAEPEAVAAHLLLCEPGGDPDGDRRARGSRRAGRRARRAGERRHLPGRALPEVDDRARRGAILHRLGRAGVALRDPASLEHLQQAAELADDPARGARHLPRAADALAMAGHLGRGDGDDRGGVRAASPAASCRASSTSRRSAPPARGYDPARRAVYADDLPRLLELVRGRTDEGSRHLRWVIAGLGACRDMPRER